MHFTYSHSSHMVTVDLRPSAFFGGDLLGNWMLYTAIIAAIVAIIVVAAVLVYRRKKTRT